MHPVERHLEMRTNRLCGVDRECRRNEIKSCGHARDTGAQKVAKNSVLCNEGPKF